MVFWNTAYFSTNTTQMDHQLSIDDLHIDADPIGRGSSADVYPAQLIDNGESAIVKIYNSMAVDPSVLHFLYYQQQANPSHPGIGQIYGYQLNQTPYYTISEFAEGKPAFKCQPFKEAQAFQLIKELAMILSYAHQSGMIHANLHPGNLIISEQENQYQLKVVDFASGLLGGVQYIELDESSYFLPPEQLSSYGASWQNGNAQKWDVYSFGAIAYWLLNRSVPRGKSFRKNRNKQASPDPIDVASLVKAVSEERELSWKKKLKNDPEKANLIKTIDRCLSLNPEKRPAMQEVSELFQQADLAVARSSKQTKKTSPKAKSATPKPKKAGKPTLTIKNFPIPLHTIGIISAGVIALCSIASLSNKNRNKNTKISQLDQRIAEQETEISSLNNVITTAKTDLMITRQVVDSTLQNLHSSDTVELERSRNYYLETLAKFDDTNTPSMEKARALHNLAHIEKSLQLNDQSLQHFNEAISQFESLITNETPDYLYLRLADCHENTAMLRNDPEHEDTLTNEAMAVGYFRQALHTNPNDLATANRMAEACLRLGATLNNQNQFEDAVSTYQEAAIPMTKLRAITKNSTDIKTIERLIAKLQFSAAESLNLAGRHSASIDAYIATIESIERLNGLEGYSIEDSIIMAKSFLTLGNIFSQQEQIGLEDREQVYNEALRLLGPLNIKDDRNIEVAVLMAEALKHIAQLERQSEEYENAYNLSVRGIQSLAHALVAHPNHLQGLIQLADSRLAHLVFEEENYSNARRISLLAIENAEKARETLISQRNTINQNEVEHLDNKLRSVFSGFATVFKNWGDETVATKCQSYASDKLSFTTE